MTSRGRLRLAPGRRRSPVASLVLLVAVVTALTAACSSSSGNDASPSSGTPTTPGAPDATSSGPIGATTSTIVPTIAAPAVEFSVGGVVVHSPVDPAPVVSPEMQAALVDTVTRYVEAASIAPLTGRAVTGFDRIFSLDATARLAEASGQDRLVLVDEGLAPATTSLVVESAILDLSVLADQTGAVAVAGAHIDVRLHVGSAAGTYVLARSGDLTLTAFQGTWFIDGWALAVTATPTTGGPATTGLVLPEVTTTPSTVR